MNRFIILTMILIVEVCMISARSVLVSPDVSLERSFHPPRRIIVVGEKVKERWNSSFYIFIKQKYHPALNGSKGGVGNLETRLLLKKIARRDLTVVRLDPINQRKLNELERMLKCQSSVCPQFGECTAHLGTKVRACSFQRFPDTPAKLLLLRNVYINSQGHIFSSKYHFDRGGCASDRTYRFPMGTKVTVFKEMVNLAHWNAANFYHGIIELLPAFLFVSGILKSKPGIPVSHRILQHNFLERAGLEILGIKADQINLYEIEDKSLFFVEELYQPWYAPCGRPNKLIMKFLRENYYVPNNGFPIFNSDWSLRENKLPSIPQNASVLPHDWIVIMAVRHGERGVIQRPWVLDFLLKTFSEKRLKIFSGNEPISKAKELFNRAKLFVAGHGAAMTNMVFMPVHGYVLEMRPRGYFNNCFELLAGICNLSHSLIVGNGTKHSRISVNVTEVEKAIIDLSRKFL